MEAVDLLKQDNTNRGPTDIRMPAMTGIEATQLMMDNLQNESEERYRELIENAPIGIFQATSQGRYLSLNPEYARLLGYESPQAMIESVRDIAEQIYVRPDERETYKELLRKDGHVNNFEVELKRVDGETLWVSINSKMKRKANGEIIYDGFLTDITDRKRAEQELVEKSLLLEGILDNVPDIMSVKRPDLSVVRYNKAGYAFLGITHEQIQGRKCYQLIGQNKPCQPCATLEAIKAKELKVLEKYAPELNMYLSCRANPVFNDTGQVEYSVELIRDISQRKQIEQALRESEERFRVLIENMAEGIVLKDSEDRYVHWNQTASEIFGIDIDELKGQTSENFQREIIHEDGTKFLQDDLPSLHTLRTGEPCVNVVMGIRRGPLDTTWIKVNTRPYFKAGSDKPDAVIISFADITEQKQTEAELLIKTWAIESSINALALADMDGNLTYANQAFLNIWGYQHLNEVCGMQAPLFWQSEKDSAEVIEALHAKGKWRGMMTARRQDGTLFNAEVSASMVLDGAGKPLCMQASFMDITERIQVEEHIRHLNAVLQAFVKVNEIIFNARQQKQLLEDICQALTSTRGYHNAWIMLLNENLEITDWAQAGLGDAFQALLTNFRQGTMSSCACKALNSPLPQVVTDPSQMCEDCPLAGSYSGRAGFAVRLEAGGRTLGLLAVSVPKNMAHDAGEHELFMNLAGAIAQGVERIRLEKIRRLQKERLLNYERIISRVNDPISLVDKDYRYIVVNDAYLRIFNKQRHEIEGRTVEDLLGQEVFSRQVKQRLDLALAGQEVIYEESFVGADGSPSHRIMSYYPFHDQEEGFRGVVARAVDITGRKRAEDALRESEHRFKTLHNASFGGIAIHDQGVILECNQGLSEITGYTYEELVGMDGLLLISQKTRADVMNKILEGHERPYEASGVRKNGEEYPVRLEARSIPYHGKQVRVVEFRDITEQKEAENTIREFSRQLEQSNAEKDTFFHIIAHDLKSPMSGLLASAEILVDQTEALSKQDIRALSKALCNNAKNTFALLEDLLQWARMSRGCMDFAPTRCDVRVLADASLAAARDLAGNKEIVIRFDIPHGLTAMVDQPMITSVIRNLVFNAIKFTLRGGEIVVTARPKGQRVAVTIRDNGIGIDQDVLADIFSLEKEKRQRGTEGEEGTGLGLVLCKQFIERHGGQISLESAPGQGTTVFFTLPKV